MKKNIIIDSSLLTLALKSGLQPTKHKKKGKRK